MTNVRRVTLGYNNVYLVQAGGANVLIDAGPLVALFAIDDTFDTHHGHRRAKSNSPRMEFGG